MSAKKWIISKTISHSSNLAEEVLSARGFDEDARDSLLEVPTLNEYFSRLPQDFKDALVKSVNLIREYISANKAIIIHGDYDADGICATTVLYKTLSQELGYTNVHYFIPNRFEHGYGLSSKSIQALLDINKKHGENESLVITVDCGITAVEEVKQLRTLGHSVLLTDHHQKGHELPDATVLLWYDKVVGATIAWLLSKALGSKDVSNIVFPTIATITDLQPVLDFNRSIVKNGLAYLNEQLPLGIDKIFQVSGRKQKEVATSDLGWVIGPRLNASGRVKDASLAVELLLTKDPVKAHELAVELNAVNMDRQSKTDEIYEQINASTIDFSQKVLVATGQEFHEGVIGLAAAKLAQQYYKPAIVLSEDPEGGVAKASVRSVPGVNIIELLRRLPSDLFLSLGGHPMAAGFGIELNKISELKDHLYALAAAEVLDEYLQPSLLVDLEVPVSFINHDSYSQILQLKPFGLGNEEPIFVSRGMKISAIDTFGRDNSHLAITFFVEGQFLRGVFFGQGQLAKTAELSMGTECDVVYSLSLNEYGGKNSVELMVKDVRPRNDSAC